MSTQPNLPRPTPPTTVLRVLQESTAQHAARSTARTLPAGGGWTATGVTGTEADETATCGRRLTPVRFRPRPLMPFWRCLLPTVSVFTRVN